MGGRKCQGLGGCFPLPGFPGLPAAHQPAPGGALRAPAPGDARPQGRKKPHPGLFAPGASSWSRYPWSALPFFTETQSGQNAIKPKHKAAGQRLLSCGFFGGVRAGSRRVWAGSVHFRGLRFGLLLAKYHGHQLDRAGEAGDLHLRTLCRGESHARDFRRSCARRH